MTERYTTVTTGQVGVERDRAVFEYALLRVVPRLERGECVNAGVIVYSQERAFLASRSALDEDRLRAVDPEADVVGLVPDEWLVDEPGFASAEEVREAYVKHLVARVADRSWLPEVSS